MAQHDNHHDPALHHEHSPAYLCLVEAELLDNSYRIHDVLRLDLKKANSSITKNTLLRFMPAHFTCRIPNGEIGLLTDGRGGFHFLGPGMHAYLDPFYKLVDRRKLTDYKIVHGDRGIVTVPQGYIGVMEDRGQPVLLPPGLHQWRSSTMHFMKVIDLTHAVIHIDPYTLCTVDEGYAAVTQDNGRMVILSGGKTYMLQHRNHKFEMFISQKIQTDELRNIKCASADNVVIAVQATVNWRIIDVETAARMAADTMLQGGGTRGNRFQGSDDVHINTSGALDLGKLRNDVLKQAEASLSAYIAMVNYSDTFGVSASVSKHEANSCGGGNGNGNGTDGAGTVVAKLAVEDSSRSLMDMSGDCGATGAGAGPPEASPLFDLSRLQSMVGHANEVTRFYCVKIFSINIISAFPDDTKLMQSLAKGAVAAAEAQQAETAARGKAVAMKIEAHGQAAAKLTIAKSEAEADRIRANGSRDAADTLAQSAVAVDLARIERTGEALGNRAAFFFGADAGDITASLVKNPNILKM